MSGCDPGSKVHVFPDMARTCLCGEVTTPEPEWAYCKGGKGAGKKRGRPKKKPDIPDVDEGVDTLPSRNRRGGWG